MNRPVTFSACVGANQKVRNPIKPTIAAAGSSIDTLTRRESMLPRTLPTIIAMKNALTAVAANVFSILVAFSRKSGLQKTIDHSLAQPSRITHQYAQ
jgi:hypothetical protein